MASHFEVFDKLRDLGRSLDKISSTLPADGDAVDTNKARACLQLKALLTEAKNFKEETNKGIADAKSCHNLDSVLTLCEKQASKIREDIENLEDHLAKYGYKRPSAKLPEVSVDSSEEFEDENGHSSKSESPQSSSSDKENHSPRPKHEAMAGNVKFQDELTEESQSEEVDLLATPVRPTTVTKFIHNFNPKEENPSSHQPFKEPLPPVTTTPLLRSEPKIFGFSTPESLESPVQPATQTPMIKAQTNFHTPGSVTEDSPVDDFPTPPTFATPGLRCDGTRGGVDVNTNASCIEATAYYDPLRTPPPPSLTSVSRLNPDDLEPAKLEPPAQLEQLNKRTCQFPNINYQTFQSLPQSVQKQFSFEQINLLIRQTDTFLNTREQGNRMRVTDEELMSELQIGPFTRAFALAMLKLEYFTIKKSGVYSVHDNMTV